MRYRIFFVLTAVALSLSGCGGHSNSTFSPPLAKDTAARRIRAAIDPSKLPQISAPVRNAGTMPVPYTDLGHDGYLPTKAQMHFVNMPAVPIQARAAWISSMAKQRASGIHTMSYVDAQDSAGQAAAGTLSVTLRE